jgi:hypothetical protein
MLYNLEPDRSVTGGSWYTEQDFDSEFVDLIIMLSHRFLEQKVIRIISTVRHDEQATLFVRGCILNQVDQWRNIVLSVLVGHVQSFAVHNSRLKTIENT